jgi:pyruvate,water dikinase
VLAADVGSVAPLIRTRRIQHERDRSLPAPPDTFVGQPPATGDGPLDPVLLRDLGASTGRRTGPARVVLEASAIASLQPGEILVTPQCDVGLSPVFLVAGGLVADLGGPLSHASIVARELGVPAVVNVKHASRTIRTGDLVEIDGDAGTVRLLERAR